MAPKVLRLRRPAAATAAVHPYRRPGSAADGGRRIARIADGPDGLDGGGGGNHSQCSNVVGYQVNFDDLFVNGVWRMQCFRCPKDECKAPVFVPSWWDMPSCQDMMVPCWKCGCFLGRIPVCYVDIVRRREVGD